MPEDEKTPDIPRKEAPEEEAQAVPVVYASPMKRIWAWVGVVYMVIIVFLMTYMYAKGAYLNNIASLMVIPALGGVAASSVCVWRGSDKRDAVHTAGLVAILAACAILIVLGLVNGIPALLGNFGG